ncbi:MAG TPA: sterol desaturase family protein [Dissulfurispiraceae bacterium]|nr:sterol desaturase family protein [Dissulfurispiraceae bacterium]
MNMFVIDNELAVRFGCFIGIFIAMAAWESVAPRRSLTASKKVRWANNLAMTLLNSAVIRLVFPAAAVAMALISEWSGWGILNILQVPALTGGILSLLLLDLAIYTQHLLFHRVKLFWSLHRMHHTDLDIDVTTGARFHPVEIVLSMEIKIAAVILIGAPAWSVLLFEVVLNATSMFNHSNVRLPAFADRILRRLVVTPDMHRVHHSVITTEMNSNFGFNFPWWDRLFGTYRDQPEKGHEEMTIGLADFRDTKFLTLQWMLAVPFLKRGR